MHNIYIVTIFYISKALLRVLVLEGDADTSKHVGVLMIYKILFIYIYIYMCCAFVGLDNKLSRVFKEFTDGMVIPIKR